MTTENRTEEPIRAVNRPTIIYIRHGQTDWNAESRFQGRRDIPLNDTGRDQARRNGRRLRSLISDPRAYDFTTSPLQRTRETMEIALGELSLPLDGYGIDERLIEASYGMLEGTTLAEFKANDPEAHRRRKKNRWHFCPPGGESHKMVFDRIRVWADGLKRDCVVVGHGVVGRALRHYLVGLDPDEVAGSPFPQDRLFIWRNGEEELV